MTSEKENFVPEKPAYASKQGVRIWEETDKNGKPYLNVKILNLKTIPCFKVEKKAEPAKA